MTLFEDIESIEGKESFEKEQELSQRGDEFLHEEEAVSREELKQDIEDYLKSIYNQLDNVLMSCHKIPNWESDKKLSKIILWVSDNQAALSNIEEHKDRPGYLADLKKCVNYLDAKCNGLHIKLLISLIDAADKMLDEYYKGEGTEYYSESGISESHPKVLEEEVARFHRDLEDPEYGEEYDANDKIASKKMLQKLFVIAKKQQAIIKKLAR